MGSIFQNVDGTQKRKKIPVEQSYKTVLKERAAKENYDILQIINWTYKSKIKSDEELYFEGTIYHGEIGKDPVFLGVGNKTVFCLKTHSGKPYWSYSPGKNASILYPAPVSNEKIFVLSSNGDFESVGIESGNKVWQIKIAFPPKYSVQAGKNKILVVAQKGKKPKPIGKIVLIGTEDGSEIWENDYTSSTFPLILKDRIVFNSFDGNIHSLNLENGELLWSRKMLFYESRYSMISSKNQIFISENEAIYAVDANDGKTLWQSKTQSDIVPELSYDNNSVYVMTKDGFVYGFSREDGKMLWKYKINPINPSATIEKEDFYIKPIILNNNLIISRSDSLFVLNVENGKLKGNRVINEKKLMVIPPPVLIPPDYIFCTNGIDVLYLFDIKRMKLIWEKEVEKTGLGIVSLGRFQKDIYVMTNIGQVFCINLEKLFLTVDK